MWFNSSFNKEEFACEKGPRTYLPTGVDTGSSVKKVGGYFVRI